MKKLKNISTELSTIDDTLYQCVANIDILDAIAPKNYQSEKALFFEKKCSANPNFAYKENNIALFEKKRALFNIPIEKIRNKQLYRLYSEVIQAYIDKLDQFRHIGHPEFLYDSLRYYGEPSQGELKNASYLLHITAGYQGVSSEHVAIEDIQRYFENFADANQYPLNLTIEKGMIANALVSGEQVKISDNAKLSNIQLKALAHHELGVHLASTLNAQAQPLKILRLGSPVNTTTQEGLAMLCEYLAGFMTFERLRTLALRVIAVNSMITEKDFKRTFNLLIEEHHAEANQAFAICARAYRGGGFTKDYLYLKGFQQVLAAYQSKVNIKNLLCGKVSLEQLSLVDNLIGQGYFIAPKFISPAIRRPSTTDPVLKFIVSAIK
ncbi:flavohemoglobin expression-modulating QEGLA motif protein [Litorilituus sediminis]|uniref:Flavohemoglobin expression-modulating QEGLA motif protein n=1 Tax=Litorilituus sediminis TaxID=718192 RepID=A0A4P6PAB2_9GAMM|nr:flavohemoglobin expression-modulating QEGLA motif protein [Litorilituus sediminis]QBG36562.1 flavohemoglobin expression-modulating QEGLA motif protein [Litorilituus sediminis]